MKKQKAKQVKTYHSPQKSVENLITNRSNVEVKL